MAALVEGSQVRVSGALRREHRQGIDNPYEFISMMSCGFALSPHIGVLDGAL